MLASRVETNCVQKVCRVIAYLAEHGTDVSMRELGAAVGLPSSTVHRICQDLANEQMLIQDPRTKRYEWGESFLKIARATYQATHIRHLALPLLDRLVTETSETALLVLYQPANHCIMFTDQAECDQPLRYHPQMDVPLPLHAGASGKSVLAFLSDTEIEQVIQAGLGRVTDSTVIDPKVLKGQLDEIRRLGLAISHSERTPGAVGIAAPVFDRSGVVGALMVTIPEYRCNTDVEKRVAPAVRNIATELSHQLGCSLS